MSTALMCSFKGNMCSFSFPTKRGFPSPQNGDFQHGDRKSRSNRDERDKGDGWEKKPKPDKSGWKEREQGSKDGKDMHYNNIQRRSKWVLALVFQN